MRYFEWCHVLVLPLFCGVRGGGLCGLIPLEYIFREWNGWTVFKVFIEFCYNIASLLWFGFLAARHLISASQPVIKSVLLEGEVLTTGPPGKSLGESLLRLFNYKAKIVLQKSWTSLHSPALCGTVCFALLGPKIKGWHMLVIVSSPALRRATPRVISNSYFPPSSPLSPPPIHT